MKYMLLIHQGAKPLPGSEEWGSLSEGEQKGAPAGSRGEFGAPACIHLRGEDARGRAWSRLWGP